MAKQALKSLQRSAWVLLFALACQTCWAKEADSEEEQEKLIKKFTSNWFYVCELLIVIVLSLMFEKGQDLLSEKFRKLGRQGEALNLMMECLTNEIMILGFIGLLVYVATKTDVALALARRLYPSNLKLTESDDPLAETFETVHMIIFCVMVCFISQVSLLMYKACYLECAKWRSWEHIRVGKFEGGHSKRDAAKEFATIANLCEETGYTQEKEMLLEMNPFKRLFSKRNDVRDLIQWRLLRHDFMFPNTDDTQTRSMANMEETAHLPANQYAPREPAFFQFSMYLDTKMGETFVKLIEVDYATWGLMAFFSLFLPLVISFDQYWYSTIAAICSWSIVLCMFVFGVHVVDIYNKLTPELPPATDGTVITAETYLVAMKGTSAQALKGSHRRKKTHHASHGDSSHDLLSPRTDSMSMSASFGGASESLPLSPDMTSRDLKSPLLPKKDELSHRFLKRNAQSQVWFKRLWSGGRPWYLNLMTRLNLIKLNNAPNDQERFFFFHEASPKMYKHFVGDLLFFQSVVTSMYLVMYCIVDIDWGWFQVVVTVFGLCGPAVNLFWLVPKIVGKVVVIMNIEYMKDKHVIEDVINENKRHQLVESLKILEFARMEGKVKRILDEGDSEEIRTHYSHVFDTYSKKKKDDIKHMFEMFDEDSSGSISKEEMTTVIMSMNVGPAAVEAANKLWDLVDDDGSGSVEWEEFRVLVAMVFHKDDRDAARDDDKALFHQFDDDGSGEITISELTLGFKNLGVELDDDSIASLVSQVFKKSKQKLNEEDFVEFMKGLEDMSEQAE